MHNVTVTDIMKISGNWTESKEFVSLVAEKLGIEERQAYRKIKHAVANKEIKRVQLDNGSVLYGLAEFGPYTNEPAAAISAGSKSTIQSNHKDAEKSDISIGGYEKYYCEKCGLFLVEISSSNSGYVPTGFSHGHPCPSCGFKNDISKAYAERHNLAAKEQRVLEANISEAEVQRIVRAIELARHELRFFREPTVKEIAAKLACNEESARFILSELVRVHLTDWEEQSEEHAQKEAKDAINLAGLISSRKVGEPNSKLESLLNKAINRFSDSILRRAQSIVQNYPDLAPKVHTIEPQQPTKASKRPTGKGIVVPFAEDDWIMFEWPEETQSRWRRAFGTEPPLPQYWGTGIAPR
jgi:rubrerythrin